MSEDGLTPEEVLLLAQAALAPGAPVKVRSYVKHSTTGKQVVVRQAIRGAAGGTGRTPILPSAQTTPVISNKALQSEAAAARAGAAVQRAALAAAKKQAAAALKQQKQQAAKNKQKKTTTKKSAAPKTTQPKTPKMPHLGNLGALGALHGGHGGALGALRGRRGRLFPGSRALSSAIAKSKKVKEANNKATTRAARSTAIAGDRAAREAHISEERAALHAQRAVRETQRATERAARGSAHGPASSLYHTSPLHKSLYQASARKVDSKTRQAIEAQHGRYTEAAHRALELAAAYRRSHTHGKHSVGAGFHEKLAGEVIKHEAKRLSSHLHMSNSPDEDIVLTQEALRIEGFPVEVTGYMNDETANALAEFLSREGIDIDASYE